MSTPPDEGPEPPQRSRRGELVLVGARALFAPSGETWASIRDVVGRDLPDDLLLDLDATGTAPRFTLRRPGGVVSMREVLAVRARLAAVAPYGVRVIVRARNPPESMDAWRRRVLDGLVFDTTVTVRVRTNLLRERLAALRAGARPNDTPLPLP